MVITCSVDHAIKRAPAPPSTRRDVKLDNTLLDGETLPTVKLCDFQVPAFTRALGVCVCGGGGEGKTEAELPHRVGKRRCVPECQMPCLAVPHATAPPTPPRHPYPTPPPSPQFAKYWGAPTLTRTKTHLGTAVYMAPGATLQALPQLCDPKSMCSRCLWCFRGLRSPLAPAPGPRPSRRSLLHCTLSIAAPRWSPCRAA